MDSATKLNQIITIGIRVRIVLFDADKKLCITNI